MPWCVCVCCCDEQEETLALTAGRNQRYFLAKHAIRSYHQEAWSKLHKGSGFEECEEVYASLYLNKAVFPRLALTPGLIPAPSPQCMELTPCCRQLLFSHKKWGAIPKRQGDVPS